MYSGFFQICPHCFTYRIHSGTYFCACLNPPKQPKYRRVTTIPLGCDVSGNSGYHKHLHSQTLRIACAVNPKPPEGTDLLPCEIKYKAVKYFRTMEKGYHKTDFLILPESPVHMCHRTW